MARKKVKKICVFCQINEVIDRGVACPTRECRTRRDNYSITVRSFAGRNDQTPFPPPNDPQYAVGPIYSSGRRANGTPKPMKTARDGREVVKEEPMPKMSDVDALANFRDWSDVLEGDRDAASEVMALLIRGGALTAAQCVALGLCPANWLARAERWLVRCDQENAARKAEARRLAKLEAARHKRAMEVAARQNVEAFA